MDRNDWLDLDARLAALSYITEVMAAQLLAKEPRDIQQVIISEMIELAHTKSTGLDTIPPEIRRELQDRTNARVEHILGRISQRADQVRTARGSTG